MALQAVSERRLAVRKRPDLVEQPQWFRGRRYWVVKDPVALEYTRLREEEHAILQMLDGRASLEEIRNRFNERFAPWQLSARRLQAFIGTLYRSGLVLSTAAGQGEQLFERAGQRRRRERWQACGNPLAIRFRGVDAEPILDWLYPPLRWLFSGWVLAAWCLLVVTALALVAVQFDELQARLPDFQTFFASRNMLWLAVALGFTKVLHELGHALACRHFGGECHELGLMLLVFTPCLYCNVTDSWMLTNKWHRMAISTAGMFVELFLAAACTWIWWFSQPGLLNTICLNTMFVCSLNTLLLNGNPLLRYDGYYILSDLVEVPNLWQESRDVVRGWLRRVLLGWRSDAEPLHSASMRWMLGGYGLASMVYRVVVLVTILWFLFRVLEPLGLRVVAELLLGLVVIGGLVMPAIRAVQVLRDPVQRRRIRGWRLAASVAALSALAGLLVCVPLPFGVRAAAVIEPLDARYVYVPVEGRLVEALPAGSTVKPGEVVARLDRPDLEREVLALSAEVSQLKLRVENLESLRLRDPRAAELLPVLQEQLAGKQLELAQQRRDVERLVLRAPAEGTVLAPPWTPQPETADRHALGQWWGSPLEPRNLGSWLATETLVCVVGQPGEFQATLFVEQSEIEFVRPGQRVRLAVDAAPGRVLRGTIQELAAVDAENVPRILAESDRMPTRPDATGRLRPVETLFQVRVRLDEQDHPLLVHACGRARIVAAPQSLAQRLLRYLSRTFA
ncbi:MAG: HlyD family efflux transporter periplasmic adaptor subunit [Pirellulaceae bacterium]|nr:HlyD family efflux transporter periplasmic adaptor subunit [Pirellulaceae bacterium]